MRRRRRHRARRLRQLGGVRDWSVPPGAVSGIYLAVPKQNGAPVAHIPFVVRDDDGRSDLLFQTSDTTWQAYNRYGGNSLYTGSPAGRAYEVSYNRPFTTASDAVEDWLFNAEYPMIRWLERNGYDVSYSTGVDSDRRGAEIREHKAFLSVGHDEYWSGGQRANVEAARDAGVNLAFFSGNEVFWKTRWTNNHRTLVCLQGDPRGRQDRPGAGNLDRHVARPARVQPGGCAARERAHRDLVLGQLRHAHDHGARRPTASCASGAGRASRASHPATRRR